MCLVDVVNGDQINEGHYTAEALRLLDENGEVNKNYRLPDDPPDDEPKTRKDHTIEPALLYIPEQKVTYNGTKEISVVLKGVPLTDEDTGTDESNRKEDISSNVGI